MALLLSEVAKDYLNALRYEAGCSPTTFITYITYITYQSWVHHLQNWLKANGHPDAVESFTTPTLRAYQYSLSKRNLRPRTIRSAFYPLKVLANISSSRRC